MCAKSDQPDSRDQARDQAMDRLLKQALQPASPANAAACPDAELVAAYADQGLAESERAQLEHHFAICERCQQFLAALGKALEAPAGASVAVMPAPAAAPVTPRPAARPAPSPQRWLWWLSPAFGAAAAALLWLALRPAAPAPVQTAAYYSRADGQEPRALNAPVASSPEPQPPAAARRDAQALDHISKAESAAKETPAETRERAVAQLAAPSADSVSAPPPAALPAAAVRSEVATAAAPVPVMPRTSNPPAPTAQGGAAVGGIAPNVAVTEVNTYSATLGGTPLSSQTTAGLPIAARSSGQLVLYTYSFTSPEGGAQWRLGAAGLIEKSTDNGRTWQPQSSGVTVDLLAGSASSDAVAWIVGRAAVILRTTDGRQWQRIAPPTGITGDWVTVVVRSATSATVVGPIRRFATEDGGMTWTEQQ